MNSRRAFFVLISALALPMFALAQEPEAQPAPAQAEETQAPKPAAPAAQDGFTDALVQAYKTNPRLDAERRRLESVNEQVSQAFSGFRPTVSTTYQKGRQRSAFDGGDFSYNDSELRQLTLDQPLFRGGGTISRYQSAKKQVEAAREQLKAVEQQVLLDAITAYVDVITNQSVVKLSANNVEVLTQQLQASQERFDVGEVTRTDVAQSEARLSRAQSENIQANGDLISSLAEFERVMGFKPENEMPAPSELPALPGSQQEALDIAQEKNPQLKRAEYQYESSDYDIHSNVASILPTVSLQGRMSRDDGTGFSGSSSFDEDSLLVNVTMPLYQSGAEYSRVRQAKKVSKQREFEKADAKDAARESVIQAWEDLETSNSVIKAQEEAIRAAEIALDGVKQEQQYGARTVLDVLDAEQELFVARVNLVRAQRNRTISAYALLAATGQLTASNLGLKVALYDPTEDYDDVKFRFLGF